MRNVSVKAHYDGERIQLDEPCELAPNTPLLVTVLSRDADDDRAAWLAVGKQALARAFGDDEPEYTAADVRR